MSPESQPAPLSSAGETPLDGSATVRKNSSTETMKKQAPSKVVNEKPNKTSNMTVETETVDTSSINILPINHDLIPKGAAKKETNIDDSDETFLYDNSLQAQFGQTQQPLPPLQLQVQLQSALNQRAASGQGGPQITSVPTSGLSNPSTINTTGANGNGNTTMMNSNQAYVNGHLNKNTPVMRKPRFTQRNSSFHSIQQINPEVDSPQHGVLPFNQTIQETNSGVSNNTTTESSTEFSNNNMLLESKYSDHEDDEDFDSSTYNTYLTPNRSNTSPRTTKLSNARRVTSMKLSQPNNWAQHLKGKPYSTLPQTATDAAPLLRTITSKLFDSKGTQPRRYSGLPQDIDFDDFDDDYLEDYEFGSHGPFAGTTRLGDDEADMPLRYGNKKQNYGAVEYGGNGAGGNVNGFNLNRLKKHRRNSDLYYSPHNFPNSKGGKWRQIRSFCYTFLLILVLLLLGFISGFLLASTKDLQSVKIVDVNDIIISQEELVFNLIVDGFNPGFINIEIKDVELEVFAKSSHVHDELYKLSSSDTLYETVLLGSITELEIPLKFQGGFFSRQRNIAISEVKILNPCSSDEDPPSSSTTTTKIKSSSSTRSVSTTTTTTETGLDYHSKDSSEQPPSPDQEKWHNIAQHPFDLIIRGVLKYHLPILNENKTVGVNKVVMVDPDNLYL